MGVSTWCRCPRWWPAPGTWPWLQSSASLLPLCCWLCSSSASSTARGSCWRRSPVVSHPCLFNQSLQHTVCQIVERFVLEDVIRKSQRGSGTFVSNLWSPVHTWVGGYLSHALRSIKPAQAALFFLVFLEWTRFGFENRVAVQQNLGPFILTVWGCKSFICGEPDVCIFVGTCIRSCACEGRRVHARDKSRGSQLTAVRR